MEAFWATRIWWASLNDLASHEDLGDDMEKTLEVGSTLPPLLVINEDALLECLGVKEAILPFNV